MERQASALQEAIQALGPEQQRRLEKVGRLQGKRPSSGKAAALAPSRLAACRCRRRRPPDAPPPPLTARSPGRPSALCHLLHCALQLRQELNEQRARLTLFRSPLRTLAAFGASAAKSAASGSAWLASHPLTLFILVRLQRRATAAVRAWLGGWWWLYCRGARRPTVPGHGAA